MLIARSTNNPLRLLLGSCLALVIHDTGALAFSPEQTNRDCCIVLGIDRHRSVVMAKDRTSGRRFLFAVRDRRKLGQIRVGHAVAADFDKMEVSGVPPCEERPCAVVVLGASRFPPQEDRGR